MAYNFIECNRDQQYLMPPSVKEWLPEGDLSWFVIDAVGQMELKEFYSKYRGYGCGRAAFNPKMMVSLLLYGYSFGERSSRRIEIFCERDVGFYLGLIVPSLLCLKNQNESEKKCRASSELEI